jgi:small subunit ribosomal protein S16
MAVRIRLRRTGRKGAPYYRIVVADSRSPRNGRFLEVIGHYEPRKDKGKGGLDVDAARANHWLDNGALPTDTVRSLLRKVGLLKARHEARLAAKMKDKAVPLAEKPDA